MSLSYPDRSWRTCLLSGATTVFVLAGALSAAPVQAAQTYWQPRIEATVEQNTNRNLSTDPALEADVTGYFLSAEVLWGYATPTSDTQLLPRVRFQRFPDQKDIQRSEQFLDFSTTHRTAERSTVELVARYSRQDAFRSELGEAGFDDFDPEDPTDDVGGSTVIGADTRTRAQLRPSFTHEFSELTGFLIGGVLETVRYKSDVVDRTDYDYAEFRTLLTRRTSPRTQLLAGPMVSRYETRDNRNTTDDVGFELAMDHELSEITRVGVGFFVRRSDIETTDVFGTDSVTETNYGFDFSVLRRTEVGRFRFSTGRTVRPTSAGNMAVQDQLRLQYDHDYSERLSMRTAVRAYRRETTGRFEAGSDRDYARGELRLRWMMTRTTYIAGGYEYTWRDVERVAGSADNHAVFLTIGYVGLGRPD